MDSTRLTLDQIAIHHQTDRASVFTRTYAKPHDYARHYDKLFTPLRDEPVRMLEIGAAGGEGIKMWMDYFADPDARIYGVDVIQNTNPWNTPGTTGRYTFCQGDQSSDVFWKCFIATYGTDWDIIIDDGGHFNDGIITSFIALWPHVKPGGFYAIEDLGVAYGAGSIFVKPGFPNHIDWVKSLLDEINIGNQIDSMYCSKELVVLRKGL